MEAGLGAGPEEARLRVVRRSIFVIGMNGWIKRGGLYLVNEGGKLWYGKGSCVIGTERM